MGRKVEPMNFKLPIVELKSDNFASYSVDSGVDIAVPYGTKVYAPHDGYIIYSEWGHTPWCEGNDTNGSILILLIPHHRYQGINYNYIWMTHLSKLVYDIRDGEQTKFITQGTYIGKTGRGNNNEHLHMGLLISRAQKSGDYLPAMQFQHYLKSLLVKENRE